MRVAAFVAVIATACSGERNVSAPEETAAAPVVAAAVVGPTAAAAAAEAPPAYGPEVASLRLKRSIVVRFAPDEAAKALGTVEASTRVAWTRASAGPGCARWIEIAPRGWICDKYLEPSNQPPDGAVLPRLDEGEIVPGIYGKVAGTGVTVRKLGEVVAGGRTYWKTSDGKKYPLSQIRQHEPSRFAGIWLDTIRLPFAWAQSRKSIKAKIVVRRAPAAAAPVVEELAPRTVVPVEESRDGWTRVGEDRWIATEDLHIARAGEPS
jgi:hypothetical protein